MLVASRFVRAYTSKKLSKWGVFFVLYFLVFNGDLVRKFPYAIRIRGNTDQKKLSVTFRLS